MQNRANGPGMVHGLESLAGAERIVGMGFRCWISGYQTGNISNWEHGWNYLARELGPGRARLATAELTGWARSICSSTAREINVCPFVEQDFCRDECMAVSIIAACQHNVCPAMEACAFALLGVDAIEPVVESSGRLAHVLQSADIHLSDAVIASGMTAKPDTRALQIA